MATVNILIKEESGEMALDGSGLSTRPAVLRKLLRTQLNQFASMAEYLVSILSFARKLEAMEKPLDDECVAVIMLNGLPDDFEPFVLATEHSNVSISTDVIKTKLLLESDRIKWNHTAHIVRKTTLHAKQMKPKNGQPKNKRSVRIRARLKAVNSRGRSKKQGNESDDEEVSDEFQLACSQIVDVKLGAKQEKEENPWGGDAVSCLPDSTQDTAAGGNSCGSHSNPGRAVQVKSASSQPKSSHIDWELPFQCNLCQERFSKRELVFEHLKENHQNETPFSCPICRNLFSDQVQMKVHQLSHKFEKDFPCPVCGVRLATKKSLAHHLKAHDRDNVSYDCKECGRSFQRGADLKSHIKMHARKDEMRCGECGERFEDKDMLATHMMSHDREKRHVCNVCDKRFKATGSLKCHLRTHTGEKPFACDKCPKRFRVKYQLAGHLLVEHGDNSFIDEKSLTCQHCNKLCASIGNLQAHLRSHAVVRHYQCTQCSMGFKHSSNLREHVIRKHTNDFPFECEICKKRTKTKGSLVAHMGMHHGIKRSSNTETPGCLCPICGKHIKNKHRLQPHLKVHSSDRPFLCNQCGQTFKYKAVLKEHQLIHNPDKPYKCTMCEKSYRHKSLLTAHIRWHTGEAPFICETCGRAFRTPKNLKVHIRTHTGEAPYGCGICGKSFKNRSNYTSHVKTHRIPP